MAALIGVVNVPEDVFGRDWFFKYTNYIQQQDLMGF